METKIDPSDLAAHNAKVARAYRLQIDAQQAVAAAQQAVAASARALAEKYALDLSVDRVDDETGAITRAPKKAE